MIFLDDDKPGTGTEEKKQTGDTMALVTQWMVCSLVALGLQESSDSRGWLFQNPAVLVCSGSKEMTMVTGNVETAKAEKYVVVVRALFICATPKSTTPSGAFATAARRVCSYLE